MSDFASRHAARIADLKAKLADVATAIAGLPERRKQYALQALANDKEAARAIAEIDAEGQELLKTSQLVSAALEEAERIARQDEAEEAKAARAEREAEAKRIGAAVCTLNTEIDTAMTQLREMFERREHLLSELRRVGGATSARTLAMVGKEPSTAAARHAGLAKFVSIEPVPIPSLRPLASSNGALPH